MSATIRVTGLRELQGAFRQIDRDLPKELRVKFLGIAKHVVGRVQSMMPHISGEAAGSLKARATQKGAGIGFPGGEDRGKGAYYPWLDFGGSVGLGHRVGAPWSGSVKRPLVKGGRYLYPAIADSAELIVKEVDEAIREVAEHAGFQTRGGSR